MMPVVVNIVALTVGQSCSMTGSGSFLGFPTWYSYLPGIASSQTVCSPSITSISDIWLIVAAVIEILLRLAALAAFVFIIIGGVKLITSQGDPGALAKARSTILNAVIGLVIAVTAAFLVTFIAQSIK